MCTHTRHRAGELYGYHTRHRAGELGTQVGQSDLTVNYYNNGSKQEKIQRGSSSSQLFGIQRLAAVLALCPARR